MTGRYEIVLGALIATAFLSVFIIFIDVPPSMIKDLAGPVATVVAAAAAAWVAYRLGSSQVTIANLQAGIALRTWRTANEKIVLDLFEKRIAIYEQIREAIGPITRSGQTKDEDIYRFGQAIDRVQFFFGPDVTAYLETLRISLINHQLACTMSAENNAPDRQEWIKKKSVQFQLIMSFYSEALPIFAPYIQAHQKATDEIPS